MLNGKKIKETYGVDIDTSHLSEEHNRKVNNLFQKWNCIFPKLSTDLGHTSAVRHKIGLTDE